MSDDVPAAATVLVVDDDAACRALLRDSLLREGFQVVEEARGDAALARAERERPDVVVLDDHMPGRRGLDLLDPLRRRWPGVPIVLMSAFGARETAERALGLGAARYLPKPFRIADFVAEIRRLSTQARKEGSPTP